MERANPAIIGALLPDAAKAGLVIACRMPSPVANMASALDQFTDILRTQGVAASLRYLNQRVEHRCTAIYGWKR